MRHILRFFFVPLLVVLGFVAACSSDDTAEDTTAVDTTAPTAATDDASGGDGTDGVEEDAVLRILLSNDDGIGHPGLQLMLDALLELPNVEVSVVAPLENQSGTGMSTTEGGAAFDAAVTDGGYDGVAVDGFPVDAIVVAIDELEMEPHVIVSGINDAQNIGPFAEISGTVGITRYGVSIGIPSVAVSAGLQFDPGQFGVGAALAVEWIEDNREALLNRTADTEFAVSINIPTCDPADMGDPVEVPRAEEFPEGAEPFTSDCDLADPNPVDDVAALRTGNPAITLIPAEL